MRGNLAEESLRVTVNVYDLLPPSRLGQFLNLIGSGVYHSSVSLDPPLPISPSDLDPSPQEYAFGGHDTPRVSGVFSIPAGSAAQRMPGLRFYTTVDLGEAFGDDWEREFGTRSDPLSRVNTASGDKGKGRAADEDETIAGPPHGGWMSFSRSTTALASEADERNPFRDPVGEESIEDDDGGVRDGTEYLTRKQRRAWRIIEEMKNDEEWNGTRYRLLERNCNHFTHELVYHLTGRKAPSWLNRASWVATSLPCIVPEGWIDEADEAAPSGETVEIHDPAHVLSENGSVKIEPPRADRMEMSGRR